MAPSSPSDRRKDKRYEVALKGELRFDGKVIKVEIADLSASGALLMINDPPPVGAIVELFIEEFGVIDVEVMHAGDTFCGLALANPAEQRDMLLEWLRGEMTGPARAAAGS